MPDDLHIGIRLAPDGKGFSSEMRVAKRDFGRTRARELRLRGHRLPGSLEGVFEGADLLYALQELLDILDRLAQPFDAPYRGAGGRPVG